MEGTVGISDFIEGEEERRVIVAGDVPFLRALLRMAIEEAGYSIVAEATDRETLLVSCAVYNPDMVIIDLHLPEAPETRLVEDILDIDADVAVIIISDPLEGFGETVLAAGARAYLEKPFSMYDLVDIVRKVVPSYR
jgi:DNA-binding NarL/FixJ family response regulator